MKRHKPKGPLGKLPIRQRKIWDAVATWAVRPESLSSCFCKPIGNMQILAAKLASKIKGSCSFGCCYKCKETISSILTWFDFNFRGVDLIFKITFKILFYSYSSPILLWSQKLSLMICEHWRRLFVAIIWLKWNGMTKICPSFDKVLQKFLARITNSVQ